MSFERFVMRQVQATDQSYIRGNTTHREARLQGIDLVAAADQKRYADQCRADAKKAEDGWKSLKPLFD